MLLLCFSPSPATFGQSSHCRLSRALWFHPKVEEEPSQMLLHQGTRGPKLPWERNSVCHSSTSASLGHLNTAAALQPPQLVRRFLTLSRAIHPIFFHLAWGPWLCSLSFWGAPAHQLPHSYKIYIFFFISINFTLWDEKIDQSCRCFVNSSFLKCQMNRFNEPNKHFLSESSC